MATHKRVLTRITIEKWRRIHEKPTELVVYTQLHDSLHTRCASAVCLPYSWQNDDDNCFHLLLMCMYVCVCVCCMRRKNEPANNNIYRTRSQSMCSRSASAKQTAFDDLMRAYATLERTRAHKTVSALVCILSSPVLRRKRKFFFPIPAIYAHSMRVQKRQTQQQQQQHQLRPKSSAIFWAGLQWISCLCVEIWLVGTNVCKENRKCKYYFHLARSNAQHTIQMCDALYLICIYTIGPGNGFVLRCRHISYGGYHHPAENSFNFKSSQSTLHFVIFHRVHFACNANCH